MVENIPPIVFAVVFPGLVIVAFYRRVVLPAISQDRQDQSE